MKHYSVLIIGGGASGSALAIKLAKKNIDVAVVDCNDIPAKKLLVTGNGKCNISNLVLDSKFYNQNLDSFFKKYSFSHIKNFFLDMGVHIYSDDQNRCYPLSNSAKSVVNAINNQFKKLNITFLGGETYESFFKQNENFIVTTNFNQYSCNYLVFACQKLDFSQNFKVKFVPYSKSLVALKTKQNTSSMEGVRCSNIVVSIVQNGKVLHSQNGEVLFKDSGLSGICIFNLSTFFARRHSYSGKVSLNLLPSLTHQQLVKILQQNSTIFDSSQILTSVLNDKLAKYVLSTLKNNFTLENLANKIQNLEFDIVDCYDNNQVVSGGVELASLSNNLENKNIQNMFFVGENINVDAICGGYNLSWAFTSAFVSADGIIQKIKK